MNVLNKVTAAVAEVLFGPSREELNSLAFRLRNNAHSLGQHLSRLEGTSFSKAEDLLGRKSSGIDFAHFDRLLAEADKVLLTAPESVYVEHGVRFSLASCAESLRSALEAAEPYRGKGA